MKVYVIYLPKSKRSTELAESAIEQFSIRPYKPYLFEGVDKYSAWQTYIDYNFSISDITRFGGGNIDSEIAAFISHFKLWQRCLDLNENIIILEHDAEVTGNLKNIYPTIQRFEGDILNLGSPNWGTRKWEGEGIELREICSNFHNVYKPELSECKCDSYFLFGAHAYMITPQGASRLVDAAHQYGILPADTYIRQEIVDIYDLLPHPVVQKESYSFIQRHKIYDNQEINAWDY